LPGWQRLECKHAGSDSKDKKQQVKRFVIVSHLNVPILKTR
jgi:hypothetical protein